MTKLLEWSSLFTATFVVWFCLVGGYVKHAAIEDNKEFIQLTPVLIILVFIFYAIGIVIYRALTFNSCEAAHKEMLAEILAAKRDLEDKGLVCD